MPEYQIIMRAGPTPGKVFPVSGESFTIGREPGNGIVINDAEISRKHARMVQVGTSYTIEDLGSTNGTFVNGVRLTAPHTLRPGEVIAFGEQISAVFEAVVSDPNATMLHTAKPSTPAPAPAPAPVSQPISQPIPSYAGQVPSGPEPATPAPKKGNSRTIIIIVLVLLVLCICCLCLGFFYWVDSGSRWCQILPFLVPLFGGACP
jgi:pSer/pThr/pTyr-binding forkhead associated (FHA) protein